MSIQAMIRRSLAVTFALTVTGTALAQGSERGYRDMLTRFPSSQSAVTVASATGYRGSVARVEASPAANVVVASPARGYRDVLVRLTAPSSETSAQMASR